MRNSDGANRLANLEQLAREAAAVVCKELNAREFVKLGEPRTWFDLQGAAAYLALSEQTLSRERSAKATFHRSDLDAWIRAGGVLAFKRAEGANANQTPRAEDEIPIQDSLSFELVPNHKHE